MGALIGTIFFSLYHLCLEGPLNKLGVNWLMVEFWFTAVAAFLYFTAFLAMHIFFAGWEDENIQYWIDANITAGVFALFNDVVYIAAALSMWTGRLTLQEHQPLPLHQSLLNSN